MTVVVNFILNKAIRDLELTSPSEIIKYLKNFLSTKMSDIEDKTESVKITLCVLSENKLTYSIDRNYLWISRDSDIKELEDNFKDKIDLHINLEKNDIIYLFSSGGIEQFGFEGLANNRKEEMKQILASISSNTSEEQKNIMNEYWEEKYAKEVQIDDLCALVIKI